MRGDTRDMKMEAVIKTSAKDCRLSRILIAPSQWLGLLLKVSRSLRVRSPSASSPSTARPTGRWNLAAACAVGTWYASLLSNVNDKRLRETTTTMSHGRRRFWLAMYSWSVSRRKLRRAIRCESLRSDNWHDRPTDGQMDDDTCWISVSFARENIININFFFYLSACSYIFETCSTI